MILVDLEYTPPDDPRVPGKSWPGIIFIKPRLWCSNTDIFFFVKPTPKLNPPLRTYHTEVLDAKFVFSVLNLKLTLPFCFRLLFLTPLIISLVHLLFPPIPTLIKGLKSMLSFRFFNPKLNQKKKDISI
jgi:hypothetical protein